MKRAEPAATASARVAIEAIEAIEANEANEATEATDATDATEAEPARVVNAAAAAAEPARVAEATARRSYGKLVAFVAARTRDLAAAEDALAAAFEAALRDWPRHGVPARPEAWLLTVARREAIDAARRRRTQHDAVPDLLLVGRFATELDAVNDALHGGAGHDDDAAARRAIPDDRLLLMFACAHPAIEPGVRAPLMLQTLLGFDAAAIGSAFLVAPSTMGQRLVRAKAKIKRAGIPFRLPGPDELPERLDSVLGAIYAAYAEGWLDAAGTDTRRRNLAEEAIWLGELAVALLPDAAEALGLLALMLHAQARQGARRDAHGAYVPLDAQDPALWDHALIDRAETLLRRASRLGTNGRYQLEAAVQSAHGVRRLGGHADWPAIAALYDALLALTGSPVVAINRAIAIAQTRGAAAGLAALDAIGKVGAVAAPAAHGASGGLSSISGPGVPAGLADYQPYWAARAWLLARHGERTAAAAAYRRAIGLEADRAVRHFLQSRLDALGAC